MERWSAIPGFEGYEASDAGRIRSLVNNRGMRRAAPLVRKVVVERDGYLRVVLFANGLRVRRHVHLLVLSAFLGSCPVGMEGCHENGQRSDARLCNLRWDTKKNNHADKLRHGTAQRGENGSRTLLSEQSVRSIKERLSAGHRHKDIAADFGVSKSAITAISLKKTWRHLMDRKPVVITTQGAQGDVLFRRVDRIPDDAKIVEHKDRIVVAHSETQHHHAIELRDCDVVMRQVEKDPMVCYLQIASDFADVVHHRPHDTHETMRLLGGMWEVRRQREHTPSGWRRVED